MDVGVYSFAAAMLASQIASATCVDLNVDDIDRLVEIAHVTRDRARVIIERRPWPAVEALISIDGIGTSRLTDILNQNLACVGVRAPPGTRERWSGVAKIIDGDTLVVADRRIRLIGIDAPERKQKCVADGREWPCGAAAAAALDALIGGAMVECEIYGTDRYRRALAVCFHEGADINAEIVRRGWALAWYPSAGAVPGPSYADQELTAERNRSGIWRGTFTVPSDWRIN